MISMVCPDIVVTMSPGRWALPSGMFSTSPIAPTALTRALRSASACSRPTTQAAPAMSPLMSSLPPAGAVRDPAGVEADALADEGNRVAGLLAAVPAHDHQTALVHRALPDPEQRVHAELLHGRYVEHLDDDAELLQVSGAARELFGMEHVGGLVHQIARQHDAIGHGIARR